MSPGAIRNAYILYIGAGAVAAGGIISVFRSLPMIWHGIKGGLRDVSSARSAGEARPAVPRTDRDLSMKVVLIGIIALIVVIAFSNPLYVGGTGIGARIGAALLIIVFGFLFVTVSSRLTGEIGSSSNPISGMTVATLLLTCLCFVVLGWTGSNYYVTALSIGAIVCIASSNGGTTSQDLKTGFLVGAHAEEPADRDPHRRAGLGARARTDSPQAQRRRLGLRAGRQRAGRLSRAARRSPARSRPCDSSTAREAVKRQRSHGRLGHEDVQRLVPPRSVAAATPRSTSSTTAGKPVYFVDPGHQRHDHQAAERHRTSTKFDAPKATLMSYIIKGILGGELPWGLVLLGVMIAVVLELSGIPSLAFAVGVYLPLSSSSPILIGGIIRWAVDKWIAKKHAGKNLTEEQLVAEGDKSPGVLMASGYIAGGAIAGIIIAFLAGVPFMAGFNDGIGALRRDATRCYSGPHADSVSLIPFVDSDPAAVPDRTREDPRAPRNDRDALMT